VFEIYKSFKFINICLILPTVALLTGCVETMFSSYTFSSSSSFSSSFSRPTQTIQMQVIDNHGYLLRGVKCTVHLPQSGARYSFASNPGQIKVQQGSGPLFVECTKWGYEQASVMMGEDFNNGWVPDSDMYIPTEAYIQYPSHYTITMRESWW